MRRLCRNQGRGRAAGANRRGLCRARRVDMARTEWRGRRCGGSGGNARRVRYMIKRTASVLAAALFAASFGQGLLNDVAAAQTALRPLAKPAAAPAQAAPVQQNSDAAPSAQQPDLAFGAFQRGYFLTAFAIATKRAVDDNDIKAMTLLGELYADGLGVAQDDKKAAEWYKFAASRGDSNAMFALAMFSLNGRAGPREDRK